MTWTYDTALTESRDKVRLLIGDTDTNDQQFSDEEIAFFVANEPSVYHAAAESCRALAAKYARKVDRTVGDLRLAAQQKFEHYTELAAELLRKAGSSGGIVPYAGGVSQSDKDDVAEDSDRALPAFSRTLHENAGANA